MVTGCCKRLWSGNESYMYNLFTFQLHQTDERYVKQFFNVYSLEEEVRARTMKTQCRIEKSGGDPR